MQMNLKIIVAEKWLIPEGYGLGNILSFPGEVVGPAARVPTVLGPIPHQIVFSSKPHNQIEKKRWEWGGAERRILVSQKLGEQREVRFQEIPLPAAIPLTDKQMRTEAAGGKLEPEEEHSFKNKSQMVALPGDHALRRAKRRKLLEMGLEEDVFLLREIGTELETPEERGKFSL